MVDGVMSRRKFLGAAAATATGAMILKPGAVRGADADSALRLGILGVGGRGTAVGTGFIDNTNTRVVALADLFPRSTCGGPKTLR